MVFLSLRLAQGTNLKRPIAHGVGSYKVMPTVTQRIRSCPVFHKIQVLVRDREQTLTRHRKQSLARHHERT